MMQSKGLFGKKGLDIQERTCELGAPNDDHVLVKVRACGVCGTDINFVRDWPDAHMPLGHEIAAEVVEVGKNVAVLKPGDRVIVEDCSMCGICENCKSGHPEFCRNMYDMEGQPGLGQYMSVRYNSLNKFEGLDYTIASLTEPLAVSLTAVLLTEIPLGASVAVLGNGPLGLMAARLARLRGAGHVVLTGLSRDTAMEQARFDVAADFGCDTLVEVAKQNVEEVVKSKFPNGVDRVIVSSPPESMYDALKIIRFGGIITFFGLHFGGRNKIEVDVNDLIFRKITLRPAFAEPAINFPVSNRLLRDGLVDGSKLITHTFGFDNARETLQANVDGSQPIVKAVMLPNG
ncbi:MAG: zinc-binding dehydrogenase [Kiritimatiellia bacterium]|nr:alcohol dehydrogenase catalytic domain-containing protein [Lentisphaerota bacterium]